MRCLLLHRFLCVFLHAWSLHNPCVAGGDFAWNEFLLHAALEATLCSVLLVSSLPPAIVRFSRSRNLHSSSDSVCSPDAFRIGLEGGQRLSIDSSDSHLVRCLKRTCMILASDLLFLNLEAKQLLVSVMTLAEKRLGTFGSGDSSSGGDNDAIDTI